MTEPSHLLSAEVYERKVSIIKSEMSTNFELSGFLMRNPHFEIGRQLHIKQYYYAKQYLQNVNNSRRVAELLWNKLWALKLNPSELTLVGSGDFFGPVLQETVLLLNESVESPSQKANFALVDNSKRKLSFLFKPEFQKHILIVLPITCTFATTFEVKTIIKEYIAEHFDLSEFVFLDKTISVFCVADRELNLLRREKGIHFNEVLPADSERLSDVKELYTGFGWIQMQHGEIHFINKPEYANFTAHYIVDLEADLYKAEKCQFCFPSDARNYQLLFPTKINHDTPNLIFTLPKFKNTLGQIGNGRFDQVFEKPIDESHLFGHLKLDSNSYSHFIERDIFYDQNKEAVLNFFEQAIKNRFEDFETGKDAVLIITPSHQKTSTVLEDLVFTEFFKNKEITIIHTNPNVEFIENFLYDNNKHIRSYKYVFFFDYVISGGKTFKIISDYLKYARKEKRVGFDMLLCIIDRTTEYSKREILRKLYKEGSRDMSAKARKDKNNCFAAYFKLNLPLLDAANSGNPIEEKNKLLNNMLEDCHLDFLKVMLIDMLHVGRHLNLDSLRSKNRTYPDEKKERYLTKLQVSHEISNWFYEFKRNQDELADGDLSRLIKWVTERLEEKPEHGDQYISEIIIKTLSHSPFKFYKDIYIAVYEFVIRKLQEMVQEIKAADYLIADPRTLKFYIKRSVDLKANYILSKEFFGCLKKVFENPLQKNLYINSFVRFYKELTFNSPERAIVFEGLLNDPELLPRPIMDPSISLEATFSDRFYQLGRILKTEYFPA